MEQLSVFGIRQAVRSSFELLPNRDRRKFCFVIAVQVLTTLLDLIGVLLLTVVGVLALQASQGSVAGLPAPVEVIVNWLKDRGFTLDEITLLLAGTTAIFFVGKSLISGILSRRVLVFLANRQAQISVNLIARLLNQPVSDIERSSTLTTAYAVVQGATAAVVGILGSLASIISEASLLILFAITLLIVNPLVTVLSAAYLGLVALTLYLMLGSWSARIGSVNAQTAIRGNSLVQETISAFREISVLDRRGLYVERIRQLVRRGTLAQADGAFIAQVPKYVFEAALIVGAVLLAGALFASYSVTQAVATMVLFLAAGSRVLPSILRLQSAVVTIRSSSGSSMETFGLAQRVRKSQPISPDDRSARELREGIAKDRESFVPELVFTDISFRYPGANNWALQDISFNVSPGRSVAVAGSTGAGKSTLADILLGILQPTSGSVLIGGYPPARAIKTWPGGIAYVPQHVSLIEGSVRENVALGLPREATTDEEVWEALERAHLGQFLREHRDGLNTFVGERGVKLSGGQRQRLGIARALLSRPRLLVMDEATSSLDAQTENLVGQVLLDLHGYVTLVVIAHRLASVREFDCVIYLQHGHVLGRGTFAEVRAQVAEFDYQARLLGL